jgi:undecaprenyl-diphosphatase
MLFNFALKITFQIPLSPHLGKEGFAFPSGHMQSCVVLYGWLIINTRKALYKVLLASLLSGVGLSLVYCGYHNYFDILGAMFFGSLLLLGYSYFINEQKQILSLILLAFATFLMLYVKFLHGAIVGHLWMAYYALIGLGFSNHFFIDKIKTDSFKNNIVATVFCFIIIFIVQKVFIFIRLPEFVVQMQWLIIGFGVPLSIHLLGIINKLRHDIRA